ncbi:MAG TPA: hypothetical protein VFU36_18090, partial [Jatrophihabitans sp.]|nr:hypothetical protein [Jatrophihabitans sp.]
MPDLLVLRLHPSKPMAPSGTNGFRDLLNGLTIKAYDLTFADSVDGVLLGTATGLADPHLPSTLDDSVTIADTQILQHYLDITDIITGTTRHLESVATAVIEVTRPAGHTEYPTPSSYDLRLEITNSSGQAIIDQRLDFNVEVSTLASPLPDDQKSYFALPATSYVKLPSTGAALDPSTAWVDLPADGQPPAFDQLVHAIDLVLASDPGAPHANLIAASPLTAAQARYIANQIVFNRAVNPEPAPDPSLGLDPFGALYTDPKVDQSVSDDDITKDRPRFEAELDGYYGTLESNALQLAGYVYSASAAVAEEVLSSQAGQARLEVPLITGASTPTTQASVGVELVEAGGLSPSFIVPAAYFYALAATMPSQVGAQQRFDTARLTVETKLLSDIAVAVDGGVISVPVAPLTAAGAIRPEQAARRLHALGQAETSLVQIPLVAPIETLVGDWLAYIGSTDSIVAGFWQAEVAAQPAAYLELLLQAITRNFTPLIDAINGAPYHVGTVAELVALTDQQWRDLFLAAQPPPAGPPPRIDLLPPWTLPGTPPERVEAFIRQLRTFFAVTVEVSGSSGAAIGLPPALPRSAADPFAAFVASYPTHSGGTAFSFGTAPDPDAVTAAVADVFPDDPAAQAWLSQTVTAIGELWTVTDIGAGELQFSLIEALYSRGFTSAAQIAALSPADFQYALSGTVAYPWAVSATAQPGIYEKAGGTGGSGNPPAEQFNPVNPHGSLTDCVPPRELSPLGEFEYLRQLLAVSPGSTCTDPLQPGDAASLGQLLAGRRGPLADLHVTAANLDTPLPLIDLVNESLEALVTAVPGSV